MAARAKKIPGTVNVLGYPFRIQEVTEQEAPDQLGACHVNDYRIEVRKGLHPWCQADTLLHEVFHAILSCQGREEDPEVEELFVRSLATGLVGVLKDNPEFGQWLLSTIHKTPT